MIKFNFPPKKLKQTKKETIFVDKKQYQRGGPRVVKEIKID